MSDRELINYIRECLSQGFAEQQIKDHLVKAGWSNETVDHAFESVFRPVPKKSAPLPRHHSKLLAAIIIIIVILLLIGGGVLIYFKFFPNKNLTTDIANLDTKSAKGKVNLGDTGCKNVRVANSYAFGKQDGKTDKNGNFSTIISSTKAQLIMAVNDQDQPCLTGVSLPQSADNIVIDIKSTIQGNLFLTPGILTTEPTEAETRLKMVENLSCYPSLFSYLSEQLKAKPVSDITQEDNYNNLLQMCITEMSGKLQPK